MNLVIDRAKCLRTGLCYYMHPDLFAEGADGYPVVRAGGVIPDQRDHAKDAIASCPAGAIAEIVDNASNVQRSSRG